MPIEEPPTSLTLDRAGRFFHDGHEIVHARLRALLHRSIARGPDGAIVATTGRDAVAVTVEDTPFFVRTVDVSTTDVVMVLSDGTEEPLTSSSSLTVDEENRLRLRVKDDGFWALLLRPAHDALLHRSTDDGRAVRLAEGHVVVTPFPSDRTGTD